MANAAMSSLGTLADLATLEQLLHDAEDGMHQSMYKKSNRKADVTMLHQSVNLNRFKKRERTQNWAYEEKRFLLELCKKDMSIIENKRLDADLTALKNRAWKIIHQEFTKSFGNERNCNRLKEQWRRMKACTRAEIMDYHHRLTKYGQEVADKKRPNPFTFEVWEFMQEAKKACRSEAMEGVDYSKVQLQLDDAAPDGVSMESDEDVSMLWQNASQNMCKVELKDEFSDENEDHSDGAMPAAKRRAYLASKPSVLTAQQSESGNYLTTSTSDDQPSLSINNVAATLDTLKLLKNGQFATSVTKVSTATSNNSIDEVGSSNADLMLCNGDMNGGVSSTRIFLEMQNKEHMMRMEILQVQLQTAQFNRDAAEINKMIALRNLSIATATTNDNGVGQHNGDTTAC